ncbi:MAG: hypothetical protein IT366_16265 [Candidatus Hydrogenedentes bacterium]|nr:hypothetical protein [Candidatus Hydrogenedentota bacterium]
MNSKFAQLEPVSFVLLLALTIISGCSQPDASPAKTAGLASVPPQPLATPQSAEPEPLKTEQPTAPPANHAPAVTTPENEVRPAASTKSTTGEAPQQQYLESVFLSKAEFSSDQDGKPKGWWVSDSKSIKKSNVKGPADSAAWTVTSGKSDEVRLVRSVYADLSDEKIGVKVFVKAAEPETVKLAIVCKSDAGEFFKSAINKGGDDWQELSLEAQLPKAIEKDSLSVRVAIAPGLKSPIELANAEVNRFTKVAAASMQMFPVLKREHFAIAEDGLPKGWWASARDRVKVSGETGVCGDLAWSLQPDAKTDVVISRSVYADLSGMRIEIIAHVKSAEKEKVVLSLNGKSNDKDIFAAARNAGTGDWEELHIVHDLPQEVDPDSLSARVTLLSGAKVPAEISCVEINKVAAK